MAGWPTQARIWLEWAVVLAYAGPLLGCGYEHAVERSISFQRSFEVLVRQFAVPQSGTCLRAAERLGHLGGGKENRNIPLRLSTTWRSLSPRQAGVFEMTDTRLTNSIWLHVSAVYAIFSRWIRSRLGDFFISFCGLRGDFRVAV